MRRFYPLLLIGIIAVFTACTSPRLLQREIPRQLLQDSSLQQAHIGISLYDIEAGKYLYNYQADKYFIPASNSKLLTCYAAMKYLGDSLSGIQYWQDDTAIWLLPTADPTLLHPDFTHHPVMDFLQQQKKQLYLLPGNWRTTALGRGWAWDDYNDDYAAERSPLPVYGNMAYYELKNVNNTGTLQWQIKPGYFNQQISSVSSLPHLLAKASLIKDSANKALQLRHFSLQRNRISNAITFEEAETPFYEVTIPFYTDTINTALNILSHDYLPGIKKGKWDIDESLRVVLPTQPNIITIKSQCTDSMLKLMMHRSDNFFAEQVLLMLSQQQLGYMSTDDIMAKLLKTDLKDLPQKPKWIDGSGLSRYNLATPKSFVYLLQKMKAEFGMERLKVILPTGGEGTVSNYYQPLQGLIFVKTGTLSNNCALSGYLLTQKGKWLAFSILANSYPSGATPVRRAVERFLTAVQRQY